MAIKKSLTLTSNLGEQSNVVCYIRVKLANTEKQAVNFQYQLLRDGTEFVIETRQGYFEPNMAENAPNIWTQCYSHLKTLPEFANAQDC